MEKSPRAHTVPKDNSKTFLCQDDDMSDTGLGLELVDAGPGYIQRLLADIYQFEVSIKDVLFECHSFPFARNSYFRASIESFKTSVASPTECNAGLPKERPVLRINLSELPGGSQAFALIGNFCYESNIKITKANVLDLLSASKFLGFTEDVVPNNLYGGCQRFVETESSTNGVQGILTMLAHSTNDSHVADYEVLFNKLARQALVFQDPNYNFENEIVGLLLELTKLKPEFVDATLQEFERLGVNMVDFFWCTETSTNLDSMLGCDEDCRTNVHSIISYFVKTLDKCIDAGEVLIDMFDPKKLMMIWALDVLSKGSLLSKDVIKAYVSSKLYRLEAKDIMDLSPQLIQELVSTAVSASRDSMLMREEIQHLGGLVDQVLLLEAKKCPWDGSLDSKVNFKQMVESVPLDERESHDKLYDAVACFSRSFTQAEATEFWSMVDTAKLSHTKVEAAIEFTLSHESSYLARLLRRMKDDHNSLKRKISALEEQESKRRTGTISEYCGSPFTIFVRSLDGKTICVLVQSHTAVFSIKEGIESNGSMQVERPWWLVYQGKKLLECLTIASYGIQKDCTLCIKVSCDLERSGSIWDDYDSICAREP